MQQAQVWPVRALAPTRHKEFTATTEAPARRGEDQTPQVPQRRPGTNKAFFFFKRRPKIWDKLFSKNGITTTKSLQSGLTLRDPMDGSPPGSPTPGILQARTLEWVAISFSNAWKWSSSVVSDSLRPHGLQPTRLLRPWDFPGKSTGMGCHCLL